MEFLSVLGNFSYLLVAISFAVKEMFWLRVLSILASVCGIIFNTYAFPTPLWFAINWNLLFMAINFAHIALLVRDRLSVQFTPEEDFLASSFFKRLTRVEAMKLFRLGKWESYAGDEIVHDSGKTAGKVMLLCHGQVEVLRGGQALRKLHSPYIIGGSALVMKQREHAESVVARSDARAMAWDVEALHALFAKEPSIKSHLEDLFVIQLTVEEGQGAVTAT